MKSRSGCALISRGKWLAAFGAAALLSSAGTAQAVTPANYICGFGLEGRLFDFNNTAFAVTPPPNRNLFNLVPVEQDVRDVPSYAWGDDAPTETFDQADPDHADDYADQWVGGFVAPTGGNYTFTLTGADGVRLWLSPTPIPFRSPGPPTPVTQEGGDGSIVDSWVQQSSTAYDTAPVPLNAGEFLYLQFEHYKWRDSAVAQLTVNGQPLDPADFCAPPLSISSGSPPAAITDLAASNLTDNGADLTFTEPAGGDGTSTVGFFDLRWSRVPITAANFSNASQLLPGSTIPSPQGPGTHQTAHVAGLDPLDRYYFAVEAGDSSYPTPAIGPVSNSVEVTTLTDNTVSPAGRVIGSLQDPSGNPIPNATLAFTASGSSVDVQTDVNGRFDLLENAGTASVVTHSPALVASAPRSFPVTAGQINDLGDIAASYIPFFPNPVNPNASDNFSSTTLNPQWKAGFLGETGSPTYYSLASNNLTVNAAGAGFGDVADSGYLVELTPPYSGDFVATVKVASVPINNDGSLAGLDLRLSDDPGSIHVLTAATDNDGIIQEGRTVNDSATGEFQISVPGQAPVYLGVLRQGTSVTSFWSPDGQVVHYIGQQSTPEFTGPLVVALAMSSNTDDDTLGSAVFSDFRIGGIPAGTSPSPAVVKGDLNGDGKVTVADAILALQIAVGESTATTAQLAAGDLTGAGQITVADVIKILQFAVGAIAQL